MLRYIYAHMFMIMYRTHTTSTTPHHAPHPEARASSYQFESLQRSTQGAPTVNIETYYLQYYVLKSPVMPYWRMYMVISFVGDQ